MSNNNIAISKGETMKKVLVASLLALTLTSLTSCGSNVSAPAQATPNHQPKRGAVLDFDLYVPALQKLVQQVV
jgi:predicted small lipoprotein YifL